MSIYKVKIIRKGSCTSNIRVRYQRFWDAKIDKIIMYAATLNLTNAKDRCHKSLPLDIEDMFIVVSPYEEDYGNTWYYQGYRPLYDGRDRKAYVCKEMR